MRWNDKGGGLGPDIEDRRGEGGGGFGFGGGGMRLGCGGIILLAVLSLIFKQNFFALLGIGGGGGGAPQASVDSRPAAPPSAQEDERARFVNFVVNDVQKTWDQVFPSLGRNYTHATLVLYRDATRSGCGGFAQAADRAVLLPDGPQGLPRHELLRRARPPLRRARRLRAGVRHRARVRPPRAEPARHRAEGAARAGSRARREANALSVRLELQADCLAGVWAHGTAERNILENGDVEEGLARGGRRRRRPAPARRRHA